MIRLLLACYPRSWRARFGDEFAALLEDAPLTVLIVLDVLAGAVRQRVRSGAVARLLAVALASSTLVEVIAVHTHVTENILWLPITPVRAVALAALLAPWLLVVEALREARRRRRTGRRRTARRLSAGVMVLVALFFVVRTIIEVVILHPSQPESYFHDWGGPRYLGVLLVHTGPGVLVVVLSVLHLRRRYLRRRSGKVGDQ